MTTSDPILELRNVNKHFSTSTDIKSTIKNRLFGGSASKIRAVDEVSLSLAGNQVQGIIGESGCGKTTLLRTLIGLYEPSGGEYLFEGQPTSNFTRGDWKDFWRRVRIVFQDPFNSLDPKFNTRGILREPLVIHGFDDKEDRIYRTLKRVGLNPPERYLDRFPHQLSGGEKQRVSIARALITEPDVILADEPVSMLDVSTQAAILRLLRELTDDLGVSMVYVSHDLSTVSYVCDRVNVMYLGRIIESAATRDLLEHPKHPYTEALNKAIPIPDPLDERERTELQGEPGDPIDMPTGCRFKDRCPERMDICDEPPRFVDPESTGHRVACHLHYDHEKTAELQAND
jgi:peptide/nickel transport system ATP-binding protein